MYWRVMFVVFSIALGLSAWGGISLGNWLVSHGPAAPAIPEDLNQPDTAVLNADGRPFVAQPPQPLVSGDFGVPQHHFAINWTLPEESLAEQSEQPLISIATTTITMDEARIIAESDNNQYGGIADVGGLITALQGQQPIQPVDVPPPPVAAAPNAGGDNWQAALRQELNACSRLGFFERPSCAWAARNKYCGPANAWGKTRDCPNKSF